MGGVAEAVAGGLDLSSVTSGQVQKWWRTALNEGDFELADVLGKWEMALLQDEPEARIEAEFALYPLLVLRRGIGL